MVEHHGAERNKYYMKMRRSNIFDVLEQERQARVAAAEEINSELLKRYYHATQNPLGVKEIN
jgi:hypothetical protein